MLLNFIQKERNNLSGSFIELLLKKFASSLYKSKFVNVAFNNIELLLLILTFFILLNHLSCLFLIRIEMVLFIYTSIWWFRLNIIRIRPIFSMNLLVVIYRSIKSLFRWLIRPCTSSTLLLNKAGRLKWHHPLQTKSWLTIALKLLVLRMNWNILL